MHTSSSFQSVFTLKSPNDFGDKLSSLLSTNPFQLENSQFIKYAAD